MGICATGVLQPACNLKAHTISPHKSSDQACYTNKWFLFNEHFSAETTFIISVLSMRPPVTLTLYDKDGNVLWNPAMIARCDCISPSVFSSFLPSLVSPLLSALSLRWLALTSAVCMPPLSANSILTDNNSFRFTCNHIMCYHHSNLYTFCVR